MLGIKTDSKFALTLFSKHDLFHTKNSSETVIAVVYTFLIWRYSLKSAVKFMANGIVCSCF